MRDGASPYYQPLITEEEHKILLDRHLQANPTSLRAYKTKDEYDELKLIPNKFLRFEGEHGMIFELPNPKRHRSALANLKVSNPNASLKDIVKPHQFNYKLTGMKVNDKQFSISGEELIILISDFFKKHFQINENNYEKYREFQINEYDKTIKNINEKRRKLQLQMNHISSLMENYARNFNRQNNPDELQKNVFQADIKKYQDQIDYLQKEIGKLAVSHRNAILELD
ncbi:MAG: hypothetical protein J0L86_16660 [Flavobacteriales bacterium]|nr:hypothetical protein [Flavobacteriales bacterium]